jgi:tetratricopeptide (TPR) repeat protein
LLAAIGAHHFKISFKGADKMTHHSVLETQSEGEKILASGVEHFETGDFAAAAACFEKSASLGEELAKLYYGNLLAIWFVPGCRERENVERIETAIATFESMLVKNPTSEQAEQARKSLKAARYLATSVVSP